MEAGNMNCPYFCIDFSIINESSAPIFLKTIHFIYDDRVFNKPGFKVLIQLFFLLVVDASRPVIDHWNGIDLLNAESQVIWKDVQG